MNRLAYCPPFIPMHEIIPEGKSGDWEVNHFETDEEEVKSRKLRAMMSFSYGDYYDLVPGKYIRLLDWSKSFTKTQMTDTIMERRTNLEFMERAHGDVLIGGLGIGMIIAPLLCKEIGEKVDTIRVVESSQDVIKLVKPHLMKLEGSEKLEIIEADMLEYWTDDQFNVIYFDIWAEVTSDNLPQMSKLHRRWTHRRKKDDPENWMSSWRHKDCQSNKYS